MEEIVSSTTTPEIPEPSSATVEPLLEQLQVSDQELLQALTQINEAETVESFDPATDYERSSYTGDGWPDSDGDCQSDRHEILIDESLTEPILDESGCQVEAGLWIDLYDGERYLAARLVTIDHLIPLAAAHRAGAWAWDEGSRRAFASDISFGPTHVAVGADVNQSKGDRGPDEWRPPNESGWCRYAVDWIAVKTRWSLAFTNEEVAALEEMLETCEPVVAVSPLVAGAIEVAPTTTISSAITTIESPNTTSTVTTTTGPPRTTIATVTTTAPPTTTATTTTRTPQTTTTTTTTTTVAPTPPPTTPNCHPNYSPCVTNLPGDALNCGDIGFRVTVVGGRDPYRLDGDNDGVGCESF